MISLILSNKLICVGSDIHYSLMKHPISLHKAFTPHYNPDYLTHWGRVTHVCVSKQTIIGSDNGLLPGRRQAIIWTNGRILLIRTLGTNFSEILGKIHSFSSKKMHFKMSSAKWRLFRLGLNELNRVSPSHTRTQRRQIDTMYCHFQ